MSDTSLEQVLIVEGESPEGEHLDHDPQILPPPSSPVKVARRLINEEFTHARGPLLYSWRGQWWRWETTHWSEAEKRAIERIVYDFTEDAIYIKGDTAYPWKPTRSKVDQVLHALAALSYLRQDVKQPTWLVGGASEAIVSCRNGLLRVAQRELIPHDPTYFNLTAVPFGYDPDAPEPKEWLGFLSELWPSDQDQIDALQEWFGYVISGRTDLHKMLLVVGPPRGGKGTIARVLSALIGAANVAGSTLKSASGPFGLQSIYDKPLWILADVRVDAQGSSGSVERLLSISGQDRLTVDIKYQPAWTGTLPTRIMAFSNELPRLGDHSGAIATRFIVLKLLRSWLGNEDETLGERLEGELGGILNWSLEGLDRLGRNRRFTVPGSTTDAAIELAELSSPVTGCLWRLSEIS